MSRPKPFVFATILLVYFVAFGGLPLLKGGLYLDTYEGDTYHLLDILFRMDAGLRPHFDFPTPLGILSFLPFLAFIEAGYSAGKAIVLGQLAVGLVLWPLVVYAAVTRLSRPVGYYFGIVTLGLIPALTYGGADSGAAISMHYNRWGWAISFIVLVLAILPPNRVSRPRIDSMIAGALCGLLLLLKITYFVAIVPVAAVALLIRWRVQGLIYAGLGGLFVAAIATAFLGPAFWLAYLDDLRTVSSNELRPYVGVSINIILSGPVFVGGTLLAAATVLMVRRAGHDALAAALLLLVPGALFITYQNYGNDPMWLWFMPVLLLTLRPAHGYAQIAGFDIRRAMETLSAVAIALNFPSLVNSALSNIDHAAFPKDDFVPMLPVEKMGQQDIHIRIGRAYTLTAQVDMDRRIPALSRYSEIVEREPLSEIGGVTLPQCEWMAGPLAYFEVISADLVANGVPEGSQLFTTDILSAFHLFGPFEPLERGAPWYYGNLTGLENADYVLIPKCTFVDRYRRVMIDELLQSDAKLDLVLDNDIYALFTVDY